jgi:hypothetical protein
MKAGEAIRNINEMRKKGLSEALESAMKNDPIVQKLPAEAKNTVFVASAQVIAAQRQYILGTKKD